MIITSTQAREAISEHLKAQGAELLDEPIEIDGEWRGLVAVTPWGPLVIAGFRLSPKISETVTAG